jgi:hypothetical protein
MRNVPISRLLPPGPRAHPTHPSPNLQSPQLACELAKDVERDALQRVQVLAAPGAVRLLVSAGQGFQRRRLGQLALPLHAAACWVLQGTHGGPCRLAACWLLLAVAAAAGPRQCASLQASGGRKAPSEERHCRQAVPRAALGARWPEASRPTGGAAHSGAAPCLLNLHC